jgi:universal stress protein A
MPFPYKRILCPVDFDEFSKAALNEAAALASSCGATIHVLHVVPATPALDEAATGGLAVGEVYEPQMRVAREQLERMLAALPPEVRLESTIEFGSPAAIILNTQLKPGVDLIVMTTHGRRGLTHLVLGSVAETVVRESRVPVLTIRPSPGLQRR